MSQLAFQEAAAVAVRAFKLGGERMQQEAVRVLLSAAEAPGVETTSGRDALKAAAALISQMDVTVTAEAGYLQ